MRALTVLLVIPIICFAVAAGAGTIKKLDLACGEEEETSITTPVYSAEDVVPVVFGTVESAFDRKAPVVRRLAKGLFNRGVQYGLDRSVDLGALMTEALGKQAAAMGIDTAGGDDSWQVNGSLKEIYLESKQVPYGPVLFYGYMTIELNVSRSDAETQTFNLRLTKMFHRYNAGMGRKDEAREALAGFLIQSAQEIVARLNRELFKAPAHPSIAEALEVLKATGTDDRDNELLRVGLSGSREAVPDLLNLLQREKQEAYRVHIINALANIGEPGVKEPLAARYATEDEDCRLFILKAMEYIGGDDGIQLIEEKGMKDKDVACRSLAAWLSS
jgi:hypothetical protein